jgi:hypothetical protein
MKSLLLKSLFIIGLISGVLVLTLSSCKKESTEIPCEITVKLLGDTMQVVPFADVVIGKDYDDVRVDGKTDATGIFTTTFKLEAILYVNVSKDTNTGVGPNEPVLTGVATVRLRPGETARKTVFIN